MTHPSAQGRYDHERRPDPRDLARHRETARRNANAAATADLLAAALSAAGVHGGAPRSAAIAAAIDGAGRLGLPEADVRAIRAAIINRVPIAPALTGDSDGN